LLSSHEGRDFEVVAGDCNEKILPVLNRLASDDWDLAPTFAFLDQHAAEIRWSTLEALAGFKYRAKTKAELWMLFAPSMLPRGLASRDREAARRFAHRVTEMYGTDEWEVAHRDRRSGRLSPERLRDELLNLMRWRIERVLGYKATHSFGLRSATGIPLYSMIFATAHDAGERIMSHLYRKAAEEQPQMRADALARLENERDITAGRPGLFDVIPRQVGSLPPYRHEPPQPPYWLSTSGQGR
jgi:three-Cys-motif partner protein